jgi:fumarate reductase (CoM/CoB) subunit A
LLDPKRINYRDIQLVVAPEAHFFMGGVVIDEYGQSNIRGLFAAGENAGGVHGGNRLNSNAIPDTQVFGYRAGLAARQSAAAAKVKLGDPGPIESVAGFLKEMTSSGAAAADYATQLEQLRNTMTIDLGIVRTPEGLNRAIATAHDVRDRTTKLPVLNQSDLIARRELEDLCATAVACAASALHRTESRASHYRSDFPDSDPAWVRTVVYDSHGLTTSVIDVEPDEGQWAQQRNAATPAPGKGEKEYVE